MNSRNSSGMFGKVFETQLAQSSSTNRKRRNFNQFNSIKFLQDYTDDCIFYQEVVECPDVPTTHTFAPRFKPIQSESMMNSLNKGHYAIELEQELLDEFSYRNNLSVSHSPLQQQSFYEGGDHRRKYRSAGNNNSTPGSTTTTTTTTTMGNTTHMTQLKTTSRLDQRTKYLLNLQNIPEEKAIFIQNQLQAYNYQMNQY